MHLLFWPFLFTLLLSYFVLKLLCYNFLILKCENYYLGVIYREHFNNVLYRSGTCWHKARIGGDVLWLFNYLHADSFTSGCSVAQTKPNTAPTPPRPTPPSPVVLQHPGGQGPLYNAPYLSYVSQIHSVQVHEPDSFHQSCCVYQQTYFSRCTKCFWNE